MGGDQPPMAEKRTDINSVNRVARWGSPVVDVVCRAHLKGDETSLSASCPVILYCDTKSLSPDAGEVLYTNPYGVYTLSVTGPDNHLCPMTRYGESVTARVPTSETSWKRLKSCESQRCTFYLNYLYDMTMPGTYQISFSRKVRTGRQKHVVTSDTLTIELSNADRPVVRYLKVAKADE